MRRKKSNAIFHEMYEYFVMKHDYAAFKGGILDWCLGKEGERLKFARERMGKIEISCGRKIDSIEEISIAERIFMIEEKLGMYKDEE